MTEDSASTGENGGDDSTEPAEGAEGSTDAGEVVERVAADEAFGLVDNELRLRILTSLFEAESGLSFSELRSAVGTSDSGKFNYHLDTLRGTFVREVEHGYALTTAGRRVVGAILTGEYTKSLESDPIPVDTDCHHCGGTLAASFENELVRLACQDCDRSVFQLGMPPGAFEAYPREAWPRVAERWTRREFETIRQGFCPICAGPLHSDLVLDPADVWDVFPVGVEYDCQRCASTFSANVEATVLRHPAVVSFCYDRGVDVDATPFWELEWAVRPSADVVSEDPVRIEVPIDLDDDRLVLTLDETASVVDERQV